jgi:hypothetical protein
MSDVQHLKQMAVYAKRMFNHGRSHSTSPSPVERMIAIHDMHNAVEWLLSGIFAYYYPGQEKPFGFKNIFKEVSKRQSLILNREILLLNEARNAAQHHAIPPSTESLSRYGGVIEAFFRQTLRDLPESLEYDALVAASLVSPELHVIVSRLYRPDELAEPPDYVLETVHVQDIDVADADLKWWGADMMHIVKQICSVQGLLAAAERDWFSQQQDVHMGANHLQWALDGVITLGAKRLDEPLIDQDDPDATWMFIARRISTDWGSLREIGEQAEHETEFVRTFYGTTVSILEKLALGLDIRDYHRFDYYVTRSRGPKDLTDVEKSWCFEYVLNTIMALEPLILGRPSHDEPSGSEM